MTISFECAMIVMFSIGCWLLVWRKKWYWRASEVMMFGCRLEVGASKFLRDLITRCKKGHV